MVGGHAKVPTTPDGSRRSHVRITPEQPQPPSPTPTPPTSPPRPTVAALRHLVTATGQRAGLSRDLAPAGTLRRRPPPRLTPEQYRVLQAVSDGRVTRALFLGDLEPYLLDGREVIWVLRRLVLRGLVLLHPSGPPSLTSRGRVVLNSPD